MRQNRSSSWLLAATVALAMLGRSGLAHADEVSPKGKGITGGALLGGEVVMGATAAFGVQPTWAYLLGGVLGAGAGGYGGYLVEQNASPKLSLYMLAGGMALVIPTTVAVLEATSFRPPAEYTEDHPTVPVPVAEPPRASPGPSGLLDLDEGALRLAVPAIEVRKTFTLEEMATLGVAQRDQLHVPVFSGTF